MAVGGVGQGGGGARGACHVQALYLGIIDEVWLC